MKNSITTLLLFLLFITGFSQNYRFEYSGRLNPSVKKEKLNEAKFVHEITPELWGHLLLPNNDRFQLDEQLDQQRMISAPQQSYNYPQQNHVYPQQYYDQVIDYVSVEISGTCNG